MEPSGSLSFERRQRNDTVDFNNRRSGLDRRAMTRVFSVERRRRISQVRRYPRQVGGFSARLQLAGRSVEGRIENISVGGLSIVTDLAIERGTSVSLSFSVGGKIFFRSVPGDVIYCRAAVSILSRWICGIQYHGLGTWERELLVMIVDAVSNKGAPPDTGTPSSAE